MTAILRIVGSGICLWVWLYVAARFVSAAILKSIEEVKTGTRVERITNGEKKA